ncbi:MAG: hypothetical protein HC829_07555 [Bacteroidales bacterium]|nr:hypothetical protein [Bacteroidales bacterium]
MEGLLQSFSFRQRDDVARARHSGAAAILSKPLQLADLDAELDRIIAKHAAKK